MHFENGIIVYWKRCADDVIYLYKGISCQVALFHKFTNNLHPNLEFTIEEEEINILNYLDLTINIASVSITVITPAKKFTPIHTTLTKKSRLQRHAA